MSWGFGKERPQRAWGAPFRPIETGKKGRAVDRVQEQVNHVLEGEGLMEIDGETRVVRKQDVIFLPPGVEHSIANSGISDLIFSVVTSPVTDE